MKEPYNISYTKTWRSAGPLSPPPVNDLKKSIKNGNLKKKFSKTSMFLKQ